MTSHRARVSRSDRPLPVKTERARRHSDVDRLDEIDIDDLPPYRMTPEQRTRLVALLRPHRELLAQHSGP